MSNYWIWGTNLENDRHLIFLYHLSLKTYRLNFFLANDSNHRKRSSPFEEFWAEISAANRIDYIDDWFQFIVGTVKENWDFDSNWHFTLEVLWSAILKPISPNFEMQNCCYHISLLILNWSAAYILRVLSLEIPNSFGKMRGIHDRYIDSSKKKKKKECSITKMRQVDIKMAKVKENTNQLNKIFINSRKIFEIVIKDFEMKNSF